MTDSAMQDVNAGSVSGKPPWRPRVAGITAFCLTPVGGAFVASVNLRRLGQLRKANQALLYVPATLASVAISVFLSGFRPSVLRLTVAVVFMQQLINLQKSDFALWQRNHPQTRPASGWSSLGLGLLGLLAYFVFFTAWDWGQDKLMLLHMDRGNQRMNARQFEEARKEFTLAARISPNSPLPLAGMGDNFYAQQKWDDAIREYRSALTLDPSAPAVAHFQIGSALAKSGQEDAAIPELREALSLKPDWKEARDLLTACLIKKGDYQAACELKSDEKAFIEICDNHNSR